MGLPVGGCTASANLAKDATVGPSSADANPAVTKEAVQRLGPQGLSACQNYSHWVWREFHRWSLETMKLPEQSAYER